MKFQVIVKVTAEGSLYVEAETAEAAEKKVEELNAEASFFMPDETVDDSEFDMADIEIDVLLVEAPEDDAEEEPE